MKKNLNTISKKITRLNKAMLDCMIEESNIAIIENFTKAGIEIFEADVGVAWLKNSGKDMIVYKTPNTPKELHFKNFTTIPVTYGDHVYGKIVLYYKNEHAAAKEESALVTLLGNGAAQAITIPWLIDNERRAISLTSRQKEMELLLRQEKLKTEFIANATHEFRTPLAIMRGNIDLALLDQSLSLPKVKNIFKDLNGEIGHLTYILNDLVFLTSDNKEELIVQPNKIDLRKQLREIVRRTEHLAREKNISIRLKAANSVYVMGDENYLEKLFLNIVKNAISYGKKDGQIIIELSKSRNDAKIKIADDGIGISKQDLPRIFERFYRGDKSHNRGGGHSGLGLAIAKFVVEKHGGSIGVESVEGRGSTFTISLPALKTT